MKLMHSKLVALGLCAALCVTSLTGCWGENLNNELDIDREGKAAMEEIRRTGVLGDEAKSELEHCINNYKAKFLQ